MVIIKFFEILTSIISDDTSARQVFNCFIYDVNKKEVKDIFSSELLKYGKERQNPLYFLSKKK